MTLLDCVCGVRFTVADAWSVVTCGSCLRWLCRRASGMWMLAPEWMRVRAGQ